MCWVRITKMLFRLFGGGGNGGGGGGGGTYAGPIRHFSAAHSFGAANSSEYDWMVNPNPGRRLTQMSGDGALIKSLNPNVRHWPYTLAWTSVMDQADDLKNGWNDDVATWATANGKSLEGLFLHADVGATNYLANISSISTAGVAAFGISSGGHQTTTGRWVDAGSVVHTPVYAAGDSVVVAGNSNAALNGTWQVAAVTDTTHLTLNTPAGQSGTGGTIKKLGDGSATLANRVTFFKFDNWRHTFNPGGTDAQAWLTYRYVTLILTANDDGWFVDESASGDFTGSAINSVEYGTTGKSQFATDLAACYTAIRAAAPGKFIVINLSDYQTPDDQTLALGSLGVHAENLNAAFAYSIEGNWNWIDTLISAGIVHLEFVDAPTFDGATPVAGAFGLGNSFRNSGGHLYATPDDRVKWFCYCSYLMVVDAGVAIAKKVVWINDNAYSTVVPQSARWRAGFENDLGQPTTVRAALATGTDGAGVPVRVLQRYFSRDGATNDTVVILRRNYNPASGSYPYDATTVFTVTLPAPPAGKSWHMLMPDGTVGPALGATLDFYHLEAVILLAQ